MPVLVADKCVEEAGGKRVLACLALHEHASHRGALVPAR
jgi:hypothetical protein